MPLRVAHRSIQESIVAPARLRVKSLYFETQQFFQLQLPKLLATRLRQIARSLLLISRNRRRGKLRLLYSVLAECKILRNLQPKVPAVEPRRTWWRRGEGRARRW